MLLERLVARIEGVDTKFQRAMRGVETGTARSASRVKRLWLGVGLAIGLAVAAVVISITSMAAQYEYEMRQVWTLTDQTAEEFEGLSASVLAAGAAMGQAANTMAKATYQAVSGSIEWERATNFVTLSAQVALAGATDAFTATNLLVQITNAYKESSLDAHEAAQILFTTVKYGVTTIEQLAPTLGRVASMAATASIDFRDLGAWIAATTSVIGETGIAITGTRAMIAGMIDPTKEQAEAAHALGIDFGLAALEARGLYGVMRDVREATFGNVESLVKLFPQIRALTAAAAGLRGGWFRYLETLEAMTDETNEFAEASEKMYGSTKFIWSRMGANIKAVGIAIGTSAKELTEPFANLVSWLIETRITSRYATEAMSKAREQVKEFRLTAEETEYWTGRLFEAVYKKPEAAMTFLDTIISSWMSGAEAARLMGPILEEMYVKHRDLMEEAAERDIQLTDTVADAKRTAEKAADTARQAAFDEHLDWLEGAFDRETGLLNDALKDRKKLYEQYIDEIQKLHKEQALRAETAEEEIFGLRLARMGEGEQLGALTTFAEDFFARAEKAMTVGSYEEARRLFEKAIDYYTRAAQDAPDLDFEGIVTDIENIHQRISEAFDLQAEVALESANEQVNAIAKIEAELDALYKRAREGADIIVEDKWAMQAIQEVQAELAKLTDKRIRITVERVWNPPLGYDPSTVDPGWGGFYPSSIPRESEPSGVQLRPAFEDQSPGASLGKAEFNMYFNVPVTRETVRDVVIPEMQAAAKRGLLTPTLGGRG